MIHIWHHYFLYFNLQTDKKRRTEIVKLNQPQRLSKHLNLKLVRTVLNYHVLGTSTTAIFLSTGAI